LGIVWFLIAAEAAPVAVAPAPLPPVPPPVVRSAPYPPPPAPREAGPRTAMPRGSPGNWASTNDYPTVALRHELEGTTSFRLIVNHHGRVTHCEITQSSGWQVLDDETCRTVIRRARFSPALDAKGNAVEGSYSQRVRWALPKDDDMPSPGRKVERFVIGSDARKTDCQTGDPPYTLPPALRPCSKQPFESPYKDSAGKPARRLVTITTTIRLEDVE
jgi:TonB family protein